jgi:hypothetical protein
MVDGAGICALTCRFGRVGGDPQWSDCGRRRLAKAPTGRRRGRAAARLWNAFRLIAVDADARGAGAAAFAQAPENSFRISCEFWLAIDSD